MSLIKKLLRDLPRDNYAEGPESTFTHLGKQYLLDDFITRAIKLPIVQVPINKLKWNLTYATPDPKRVAAADTTTPILFTIDPKWGYVVIDGTHRLTKAIREHRSFILGRQIPQSWFNDIPSI